MFISTFWTVALHFSSFHEFILASWRLSWPGFWKILLISFPLLLALQVPSKAQVDSLSQELSSRATVPGFVSFNISNFFSLFFFSISCWCLYYWNDLCSFGINYCFLFPSSFCDYQSSYVHLFNIFLLKLVVCINLESWNVKAFLSLSSECNNIYVILFSLVSDHVYKTIDALPVTAHPMTQFATGVMALQVKYQLLRTMFLLLFWISNLILKVELLAEHAWLVWLLCIVKKMAIPFSFFLHDHSVKVFFFFFLFQVNSEFQKAYEKGIHKSKWAFTSQISD